MKKYRFIIAAKKVIDIVDNELGVTITAEDVVITDLETARALLPMAGINIDLISQKEAEAFFS